MFTRLLKLFIIGLVLLVGCAKPPSAALEETRRVVAYAYASGASQFAAEQYQQASAALRAAEELVSNGKYSAAEESLEQAREYSSQALTLTVQRKEQLELEKRRQAEAAARAAAAERARLKLLEEQRLEQQVKQKVVKQPAPKPVEKKQPEKPKPLTHVKVAPAENLLMIAARPEVYDDGELWPLIYKANRDQIKDPTEIFPGQTLLIPRDKSPEEIEAARIEARESKLF